MNFSSYLINRSNLYYHDFTQNTCTLLTDDSENQSNRDPRFSHNFENLCWLQNQARGPHFQCTKLMMVGLNVL